MENTKENFRNTKASTRNNICLIGIPKQMNKGNPDSENTTKKIRK